MRIAGRHRCVFALASVLAVIIADARAAERVVAPSFTDEDRAHWAYRPVRSSTVPDVGATIANPIDAFVLARLRAAGLTFSPEADRRTLIRRLTIDLHGLPPTPAEILAFLADAGPDAYERLVDRLLASPRYGERQARHWLDLARYAESDGYNADAFRPDAWRYRDWVIRALNADKPYDRFVIEQLAGDELAPYDSEALVATGYLRLWPYEHNSRQLWSTWQKILDDVTDVTGSAFLGLTVGCARCHDHKFDAISRRDYHALKAFFTSISPQDDLPVGTRRQLAEQREKMREWEEATRELRARQREITLPHRRKAEIVKSRKFPVAIQEMAAVPYENRTVLQKQILGLGGGELKLSHEELLKKLPKDVRKEYDELEKRIQAFDSLRPEKLPLARGVRNWSGEPPPATIPDGPSKGAVLPDFLSVLESPKPEVVPSSPRRAVLARWITSPDNPLTARVIVNRLWQHHFGRGFVSTPSDFGVQAEPPTHPALLDWLAREIIARDWSLKAMHRLMLTSRTYRQASVVHRAATGHSKDSSNVLLWRMNQRRAEAEVLRDSVLATSGELNAELHGKSVFPPLPKGIGERYAWKPTEDKASLARRSVYLVVKRNMHLPLLKTFDVPDNHATCGLRPETTTPTQALILLNSGWMIERARRFAGRLLRETGSDESDLVRHAWNIVYGRGAEADEVEASRAFLADQRALVRSRREREKPVATPVGAPSGVPADLGSALVDYCHALWNTNEFIYVD